jgi:hypothetical protein
MTTARAIHNRAPTPNQPPRPGSKPRNGLATLLAHATRRSSRSPKGTWSWASELLAAFQKLKRSQPPPADHHQPTGTTNKATPQPAPRSRLPHILTTDAAITQNRLSTPRSRQHSSPRHALPPDANTPARSHPYCTIRARIASYPRSRSARPAVNIVKTQIQPKERPASNNAYFVTTRGT